MITHVETGIAKPKGPVSNAVLANGTLYTAQIPKDPVTGEYVLGDITTQARQAFCNLRQAVEAAGGILADVAQITIYLIDSADAPGMNEAYREFFSEPYPNRATVVVKEILSKGVKIEIVAHAAVGSRA